MRILAAVAAAFLVLCSPVMAQDEEDESNGNAGLAGLTDLQAQQYQAAEAAYNDGDYAKAHGLLKTLLPQKVGPAWWLLGVLDYQGLGTKQDDAKSRNDFLEAAKTGNSFYMTSLGDLYREGTAPFTKDCDQAETWYKRAMASGNAVAKDRLTMLKLCRTGKR